MKKIILPLLLILVSLSSCVETTGKGNLKIVLENPQTKTLKPDERSTTVVKYNVKGVGPSGKTFSKDSSSKSITIDGLTMGTWTVTATGYNADSQAVVSGSKTFAFNSSSNTVSISLNETSGTGSLQVEIQWNFDVVNPVLKLSLEKDGVKINNSYAPGDNSKTYKYIKSGLQGGYYTLYADLYDGESRVSGTVESIQIVTNKTTSGTVNITSPSGSSKDSSSLDFTDESGYQISGHFAVSGYTELPSLLEANTEQNIRIVLDSTLADTSKLTALWFLDGENIGSGMELTKSFSAQDHTINVVVSDGTQSESLFYKFTAKVSAKKGSATLVKTVDVSNKSIILASDSLISPLPDNNFLIITPSRSSMQVISLVNNNLVITANQTYNATDLRFTWLSDVKHVDSNSLMNFLTVQTNIDTLHVLLYNRATGKIDVALWNEEPLVFAGFNQSPPCFTDNITSVALVPSSDFGGTFYVFDSGSRSEEILSVTTTSSEIKSMATSAKDSDMKTHICSAGNGGTIAVVTGTNTLKFAKVNNGSTTSIWNTFTDTKLGSLRKMLFLNSRYVLFESSQNLLLYEYYSQQKIWVSRAAIETVANDIGSSNDGAYIYIADSSANLLSYRSGLTDNFGKIYTQEVASPLTEIATNTSHILGKDEQGNLYIFDITQEDTTL